MQLEEILQEGPKDHKEFTFMRRETVQEIVESKLDNFRDGKLSKKLSKANWTILGIILVLILSNWNKFYRGPQNHSEIHLHATGNSKYIKCDETSLQSVMLIIVIIRHIQNMLASIISYEESELTFKCHLMPRREGRTRVLDISPGCLDRNFSF